MTSEVTQAALEPCPWCGTAEHLSVQWPENVILITQREEAHMSVWRRR